VLYSTGCKGGQAPAVTNEGAAEPSQPAAPAEPATPTAGGIATEEVSYKAGQTTLKGFLAYPKGASGLPGILIVHEWWGHNDYVRGRARQLAELGYAALALDMYGDGKQAAHPDDAKRFMMEVISNMEQGVARFEAAAQLLANHASTDPQKLSAIGYCFGGAVVLHMARIGMDLDVVASFHGNLATQTPAKKAAVKAKLLVAHGAEDPFVSAEEVAAFKKEMAAAGADLTFIAYPGAKHGFTNPDATALGEKL